MNVTFDKRILLYKRFRKHWNLPKNERTAYSTFWFHGMNFPFIRFNTNPILLTYLEKPSDYFWRNSNGEWSQYHMEAFYQPLREKCKVMYGRAPHESRQLLSCSEDGLRLTVATAVSHASFQQDVTHPSRGGCCASSTWRMLYAPTWRMSYILHVTDVTPPPYVYSVITIVYKPNAFHLQRATRCVNISLLEGNLQ